MSKFFSNFNRIAHSEAMSGFLLGFFSLFALLAQNVLLSDVYNQWLQTPVWVLSYFNHTHHLYITDIVNEGLMVFFFILISITIKKEFFIGAFKDIRCAMLPCFAAIGGVVVPALLFLLLTSRHPGLSHGWAIPTATDIAFSLGVLSMLGKAVPSSLKAFLTTLAVVDDLCAIVMIAMVYTHSFQWLFILISVLLIIALYLLNRLNIQNILPYALIGLLLWFAILQSGMHATLAGVIWSMFLPLKSPKPHYIPLLDRVEKKLLFFVNFIVLPLFALVNAGIPFDQLTFNGMRHPLFIGIMIALVLGKPIGILLGSGLVFWIGKAPLPIGMNKRHLISAACLGGIGFTMSFLIASLAFCEAGLLTVARQAILIGSLLSAVLGFMIFPKTSV